MGLEKEIIAAMKEHFNGRSELVETLPFSEFSGVISSALQFFQQKQAYDSNFQEPRKFPIIPENMVGYLETRENGVRTAKEKAKNLASKLYGFEEANIDISEIALMTRGSSLPLRVDLKIKNGEITPLRKVMYLKPFDVSRVMGIEFYSLIGGIEQDYNFMFNEGIIMEDEIEGKHEFEFSQAELAAVKQSKAYRHERVKMDLISFYLGLDDIAKKDNFLISQEGRIRIIDFDVLRVLSHDEQELIKSDTCKEIGITREEYDSIYKEQELFMIDRIKKNKPRIIGLTRLLESSSYENLKEMGMYMRTKTEAYAQENG